MDFQSVARQHHVCQYHNSGFTGGGDAIVKQATDSTEGFAFVLADAKALLEHNVELNLVRDRFPPVFKNREY